jgi:hypothetical protein
MPEMLPRSADMSVRSPVKAFGKVARLKSEIRPRDGGCELYLQGTCIEGGEGYTKTTSRLLIGRVEGSRGSGDPLGACVDICFCHVTSWHSEPISKERDMYNTGSQGRGRVVMAVVLGAIGGGLVVALATRAIPRMMSQMMAQMMPRMMQNTMAQMGEGGCDPAEM